MSATLTKPAKTGKASKTTNVSTKARLGYMDVLTVASRPQSERKLLPIGRGGEKIAPRKFHLSDDEIAELRTAHKEGDKLPNPQNRGCYFYIIEAGKKLGLNRKHPLKEVITTIRELMSDPETKQDDGKGNITTAWQRFRNKPTTAEDADNALEYEDKIVQNMEVLQRINLSSCTPYGLKLLQVGTKVLKTKGVVIDLFKGEGGKGILFKLNTDSAMPINELRRRRGTGEKLAKVAKSTKVAKKTTKTATKTAPAKAPKVEKAAKVATPKATVSKPKAPKAKKVAPAAAPAPEAPTATAAAEPKGESAEVG